MKKKSIILLMSLIVSLCVDGKDAFRVENLTIPQGGQASITVSFQFEDEGTYTGFQFDIALPNGINFVKDIKGKYVYSLGDCYDESHTISANYEEMNNTLKFACLSLESEPLVGMSGILLTIPVETDGSLVIGQNYNGYLRNPTIATLDAQSIVLDESVFTITISDVSDGRTVLDETSTFVPDNATDVDVRVKRTIKANEWSTIVLPFSMTESQVKSAFGNDVQLADFSSWSSDEDDDGNIIGISVGFTSNVTEIEANHPYLIKVTTAVSEFTADGVDVEVEDEPTVQVGKKKAERGYMIGTYVANTLVPENDLFVSGNKYWYSKGQTKMKAFRAYFEFADVLTSVEEAGVRIGMFFENEETGIINMRDKQSDGGSETYDLQGRKVQKGMKPGLYVKGGKKMVVK